MEKSKRQLLGLIFAAIGLPFLFAEIVIGKYKIMPYLTQLGVVNNPSQATHTLIVVSVLLALIVLMATYLVIVYWREKNAFATLVTVIKALDQKDFDQTIKAQVDLNKQEEHAHYLVQLLLEVGRKKRLYQNKLVNRIRASQKIERELSIARQIQLDMLPSRFDWVVGYPEKIDIAASLVSAQKTGGDLYDCFALTNDIVLIAVGDVCGHGIVASVLMVRVMTLIRTLALREKNPEEDDFVKRLMQEINRDFFMLSGEERSFSTLLVGTLNLKTGLFCYASAGHNPICYYQSESDEYTYLETHSHPIGIHHNSEYNVEKVNLKPRDTLLLYTDGVVESFNRDKRAFGYQGVMNSLIAHQNLPAQDVVKGLMHDVDNFSDENSPEDDDKTAVFIAWHRQPLEEDQPKNNHSAVNQYCVQLDAVLSAVKTIRADIKSFLEVNKISETVTFDLDVCVEEVVTNIIKYGYGKHPGKIFIEVNIFESDVEIQFVDSAVPFNPKAVLERVQQKRWNNVSGGRGLLMISGLIDDRHYFRKANKNYFIIRKTHKES